MKHVFMLLVIFLLSTLASFYNVFTFYVVYNDFVNTFFANTLPTLSYLQLYFSVIILGFIMVYAKTPSDRKTTTDEQYQRVIEYIILRPIVFSISLGFYFLFKLILV